MKTLKQLQVEHVANILLTAMEKEAACLELLCDEIADRNIPFCKGRKLLKSGIERYVIICGRFYPLFREYPAEKGYEYDIESLKRCDRAILGVENFYYNTNKQ
jgi:hypothetical protein